LSLPQAVRIAGRGARGFSLTEVLLALSLLGVLLAMAIPSYRQYAARGWRSDAIAQLSRVAQCQERIHARKGSYDTTLCLDGLNTTHYEFGFQPQGETSAPRFKVIATPRQPSLDACGRLELDQAGTRVIGGKAEILRRCWEGR
jgi:type IV pilus assembly protein PilE